MKTSELVGYIASDLIKGMEEVCNRMKTFCFFMTYHVHSGTHQGKFELYWTDRDSKKAYINGNTDGIISHLSCEYVGEFDHRVMLRVTPNRMKMKRYLGQEDDFITEFGTRRVDQSWRTNYFLIEACPFAIFSLMEMHANLDLLLEKVINS